MRRLEYRGYDSVGIATLVEGQLCVKKEVGRIEAVHARVDLDDPIDCLAKFKSNRLFGWLILAGLLGDAMQDGFI